MVTKVLCQDHTGEGWTAMPCDNPATRWLHYEGDAQGPTVGDRLVCGVHANQALRYARRWDQVVVDRPISEKEE